MSLEKPWCRSLYYLRKLSELPFFSKASSNATAAVPSYSVREALIECAAANGLFVEKYGVYRPVPWLKDVIDKLANVFGHSNGAEVRARCCMLVIMSLVAAIHGVEVGTMWSIHRYATGCLKHLKYLEEIGELTRDVSGPYRPGPKLVEVVSDDRVRALVRAVLCFESRYLSKVVTWLRIRGLNEEVSRILKASNP